MTSIASPVATIHAVVARSRTAVAQLGLPRLIRLLPFVVVVVACLDYVAAVIRPGTRSQVWLWTTATMAFPIWFVGAAMFTAVSVTLLVAALTSRRRALIEAALTVELGLYFFGTKIWPPTGDQYSWWQNAATKNVAISEPLSDFVHKIPYWLTGSLGSVRYVSPAFGVVTVIVFLVLARRISRMLNVPLWSVQALLVATPLPFWYVTGYIENTFLAIPFLLLGMYVLIGYLATPDPRRRSLVACAALFAVAGTFHAGFALMCGALALALVLRRSASMRRRLVDVVLAAGTVVATGAAVLGVISLFPVVLVPGNTQGGYDGDLFVPMQAIANDPLFRFTFFSHAHLIEFSNIVVHAGPALVLAIPVVFFLAWRRGTLRSELMTNGRPASAVFTVLASVSLVYLAFIAVWGFDLGSVGDLDLMLTMDGGLALYVGASLAVLLRDRLAVLAALLAVSGAINIAFYSMKVANAWAQ